MRVPAFSSSSVRLWSAQPTQHVSSAQIAEATATIVRDIDASLIRTHGGRGWRVPVDADLCTGFLARMGLDTCEPLLARIPEGVVAGATGRARPRDASLRLFIRAVARESNKLDLLPRLLAELSDGRSLVRPEDDVEISRMVHYSLCLHLITRAMAEDPTLAEAVMERVEATIRRDPLWWRHLSVFEHAKLITVEMTLHRFAACRRAASIPGNFGHVGLPFNILEAVLEDLRFGHAENVYAGLALMRAAPGQLGGKATLSQDARRAVRMQMPVPCLWKDLYVSWNM